MNADETKKKDFPNTDDIETTDLSEEELRKLAGGTKLLESCAEGMIFVGR